MVLYVNLQFMFNRSVLSTCTRFKSCTPLVNDDVTEWRNVQRCTKRSAGDDAN